MTAGAVAGVLMIVAWAAFWSPLLDVRSIRVIGGRHTHAAQVASIARLDEGANLLLLSTSRVAARARALPWVKSARVDRKLPGTLVVRIRERRPALVLSLGAARWTMDATGRVLAPGAVQRGLPVLSGSALAGIRPGARPASPQLTSALRAYRSLPPNVRAQVTTIAAPSVERVTFALKSGIVVHYGDAARTRFKNSVLRSLLAELARERRTPAYIDVSVPSSPAIAGAAPLATPAPSAPAPSATPSP
jgi:cell division protein FtsQ